MMPRASQRAVLLAGREVRVLLLCLVVAALKGRTVAFDLPGVPPIEYAENAPVHVRVNKLTSAKNQLPYSYYTLPYCRPLVSSNGDASETSPYDIRMLHNEKCKLLCNKTLTAEDKMAFRSMIEEQYFVNWLVDDLPATTRFTNEGGFPVGGILRGGAYYVNNHVRLHLMYHASPEYQGYRIVGFEVEPHSMLQDPSGATPTCQDEVTHPVFDISWQDEVTFTYDVQWTESPVRWAYRWDNYLKMTATPVDWFSILTSLLVLVFLSGMVSMLLLRTLHRDITRYDDELVSAEEEVEEPGWKLVVGDVFRAPRHARWLAVSVGSGVQVLATCVLTLAFALFGGLSPELPGALLNYMMLLFTFMGVVAGYVSARLYKVFNGVGWKQTTLLTAFLYPGIFFTIFFALNLFSSWWDQESLAVPLPSVFAQLCLWFGISVPLVSLGGYFGSCKSSIELPAKTNKFPRQIPAQPWYTSPVFTSLAGGILPVAVFTELSFIASCLWRHQFDHCRYYFFGILALVLVILVIVCAETSIALTYFQLRSQDHKWWWRSFFSSASSAFYVLLYSILCFEQFVPTLLHLGYTTIIAIIFFLLTGSIGMLASFAFVRAIYTCVKPD